MCQDLNSKEEEKVTEVNKVKAELQEQVGHLQAERAAQEGLREKIAALERQLKGDGSFGASRMVMLRYPTAGLELGCAYRPAPAAVNCTLPPGAFAGTLVIL